MVAGNTAALHRDTVEALEALERLVIRYGTISREHAIAAAQLLLAEESDVRLELDKKPEELIAPADQGPRPREPRPRTGRPRRRRDDEPAEGGESPAEATEGAPAPSEAPAAEAEPAPPAASEERATEETSAPEPSPDSEKKDEPETPAT